MAATLRAHSSGGVSRSATSQTITLTTATNAGDCVVLAVTSNNTPASSWGTGPATVSGLGATWVPSGSYDLLPAVTGSSTTQVAFFVGYNCSASQTSISLTGLPTASGTTVWGLFAGVQATANPITSYAGNTSFGGAGAAVTTSSGSYNANDLVLGFGYSYQWGNTTATWSNGSTNNNVDPSTSNVRYPWISWISPATSGSTTWTSPAPAGSNTAVAGIMVLKNNTISVTGTGSASLTGAATLSVSSTVSISGAGDMGSFPTGITEASFSGSATPGAIANLTASSVTGVQTGQNVLISIYGTAYTATGIVSSAALGPGNFRVFITSTSTGGTLTVTINSSFSPIGGVQGSATISAFQPLTGTISASLSSSATISAALPITGTGSASLTGSATISSQLPLTGSGSASLSSSATISAALPITGTGSASLSSSGTISAALPITGSGSTSLTGSASISAVLPVSGSGSTSVSGSATLANNLTGTGSLNLSGSASISAQLPVFGSSTDGFSGSATISAFLPLSGTTSATTSGQASISAQLPVFGTSADGFTGQATITAFLPLTGQGAFTTAGNGSISAILPLSGAGVISTLGNGQIVVYVHYGPGKVRGGILAPSVQGGTSSPSVKGKTAIPQVAGGTTAPSVRGKVISPQVGGATRISP